MNITKLQQAAQLMTSYNWQALIDLAQEIKIDVWWADPWNLDIYTWTGEWETDARVTYPRRESLINGILEACLKD